MVLLNTCIDVTDFVENKFFLMIFCPVTVSVERRICLPFTGTEECVDEIEDHDT